MTGSVRNIKRERERELVFARVLEITRVSVCMCFERQVTKQMNEIVRERVRLNLCEKNQKQTLGGVETNEGYIGE